MEELRKKAINYAEENYNKVMKEAFATVYAAGYRDMVTMIAKVRNLSIFVT